jgi:hypothetical protein
MVTLPFLETVERVDAVRAGGTTHLIWLNRARTLRHAKLTRETGRDAASEFTLGDASDVARDVRRFATGYAAPRIPPEEGALTPANVRNAGNVLSPRAAAALERRQASTVGDGDEWMLVYLVAGVDGTEPAAFWRRTKADAKALGSAESLANEAIVPDRVQSVALAGDAGEYRLFAFYAMGSKESMRFDIAKGGWDSVTLTGGSASSTSSLLTALAMFSALLLVIVVGGLYLLKRRMMPAAGAAFSMPVNRRPPGSGGPDAPGGSSGASSATSSERHGDDDEDDDEVTVRDDDNNGDSDGDDRPKA